MALFTTSEQLSKYIPSIVRIDDYSLFETDVKEAELNLQLDFLGEVIYHEMANDNKLRLLAESFVANRAAISFIPQLDLLLTESGFVVTSNSNQAPASKDRVERLIETCRKKTATSVDNLLCYLASKDEYYNAWKDVKFCCRFDEFPCNTNLLFTKYAIGWNDRTSLDFRNLYGKMLEVKESFLITKLGFNFYNYILQNPNEDKIIPLLTNFRMAFTAMVMGNIQAADNFISALLSDVIENKEDFPEFNAWYKDVDGWENSSNNNIVVFGV